MIVDIDGTLCDVSSIRHHVTKTATRNYRDYTAFHAAAINCPVIPSTLEWVRAAMLLGCHVILVTARGQQWERQTVWWLKLHGVRYDALWMRPLDDHRPDVEVKSDILKLIQADGYRVCYAIDDNPRIVALWEDHGIVTTWVPGWVDDGRGAMLAEQVQEGIVRRAE